VYLVLKTLLPRAVIPILRSGGIIACPTEAVWGLGCDPSNEQAVTRLLALKQRRLEKGLILVAADLAQLDGWAQLDALPSERRRAVLATWPGPQTWVLPTGPRAQHWIIGAHLGIAIRISAHPVMQELCRAFSGPLVSTSANLSGESPPRQYEDINPRLLAQIDALVEGHAGDLRQPTSIRDAASGCLLR